MILVISPKNKYATNRLVEEAKKLHIDMAVFDIKEIAERGFMSVDPQSYDCLYIRFPHPYLAQIIELAGRFKRAGCHVVDESIAGGDVGLGKMKSYEKLLAAGLPIPKTVWLKEAAFAFPYVVKWMYGFKGREVFVVRSEQDLSAIFDKFDPAELLAQEYIEADFEYKVLTVGYKALPVVARFTTQDSGLKVNLDSCQVFRAPFSGELQTVAEFAVRAAGVLGRELAKVDILEKNGKFYILEVNRWPGFESFEKLTGYNVAKSYVEYLAKKTPAGPA